MTLEQIRAKVNGVAITKERLNEAGINLDGKGKWGRFNEWLLGIPSNSSPLPDLGEGGELKTTVRDRVGRFRESIKICMISQDPIKKLEKIVLVVARDLNDRSEFREREVRNEEVVLLKPSPFLMHILRRDREVLARSSSPGESYSLEIRTAGQRSSSTRAFYLQHRRVEEYINRVRLAADFGEIRACLLGHKITVSAMREQGYTPKNKGRFGLYVSAFLGKEYSITVRTTALEDGWQPREDLLVCRRNDDPVAALERMVLVCLRRTDPTAPPEREERIVDDVIYLAPPSIVVRALRWDVELLNRGRGDRPMFLTLKSHGTRASTNISYYVFRARLPDYVRLLQNQTL